MNRIQIVSRVENGNLKRNRLNLQDAIKSFEGKDVIITIEKKRRRRSNLQNSYYFGVLIPLFQLGLKESHAEMYSKEDVHEFLKNKFLYKEILNEETSEYIRMPKSTTQLTTTEAEEYYENCRKLALDFLGVTIPLPGEQLEIS